jgi:hypothetical protein
MKIKIQFFLFFRMDEESCNEAFASKQEMVRHSEKSCSMKNFEHFPDFPGAVAHSTAKPILPKSAEHLNLEPQIPTHMQQNETKKIITDYNCSDCEAKFRDKEKLCEHFLKVHKKKIIFSETKKTDNLTGPSQVIQLCNLPILNQKLDFYKKTFDDFLIEENYSSHYSTMLFCPKCVFQFDSREQFEQHNSRVFLFSDNFLSIIQLLIVNIYFSYKIISID